MTARMTTASTPNGDHVGDGRGVDDEDRPEEDLLGGPGGRRVGRVEVEEQGGQPGRRAEHDAGGQVPAPHPLHADRLHGPGADDPAAQEPGERAQPEQQRSGPAGGRHVGQRVAAEGLAPDDGEHPDHADTTATTAPTARATRTGSLEKSPARSPGPARPSVTDRVVGSSGGWPPAPRPRSRARPRPGPGRARAARRRGGRRARLSTSGRTTSSVVPLAARPPAR